MNFKSIITRVVLVVLTFSASAGTLAIYAGEPENLPATVEKDEHGHQYVSLSAKIEKVLLRPGLLQLVPAADGKVLYGVFSGASVIKVFELPSFKEVDEIPVPKNPVSIWCDEKRIVVACDESRVVVILDAAKHTPIKSVKLKDPPGLIPFRVVGRAPEGPGIMTLWKSGDQRFDYEPVSLCYINEKDEAHFIVKATINWCTPTSNPLRLLSQPRFEGAPCGEPCIVDFSPDKKAASEPENPILAGTMLLTKLFGATANKPQDFSHCFQTYDRRGIVLPATKIDDHGYRLDWTYVTNADLSQIVFDFPGIAISEIPQDHIIVSWGIAYRRPYTTETQNIFYINRASGQIIRKINLITENHSPSFMPYSETPLTIFVPGRELIVSSLSRQDRSTLLVVHCGPVKDAPLAAGVIITNDPPLVASVGAKYTFIPMIEKINATQISFKLKQPLEGMTINDKTGEISWTPTQAYIGKYDVEIIVNVDGQQSPASKWTLQVRP